MATFIRAGGVWREAAQNNVRVSGTWRNCNTYVRSGGSWRTVKTTVASTIVSNPTTRVAGSFGTLYTIQTQNTNRWAAYVDPNNTNTLYQTGSAFNALQRSTDGGTSWTNVIGTPTGQMEFVYSAGGRIYTSQASGGSTCYRSDNFGVSWNTIGGFGGIGGGSVASAFNVQARLIAEGGNQSNVNYVTSNATSNPASWTSTSSGDNTMMEGTHNYVCRSTNWADTGVYYSSNWNPSWSIARVGGTNQTTGWLVGSPRDGTDIGYLINSFTSGSFCRSTNRMADFTALTNPPAAVRMAAWGNFVFVLTNSGVIWKSSDRGANFSQLDNCSSFLGTNTSANIGNGWGGSVSADGKHFIFVWNGWFCVYSTFT